MADTREGKTDTTLSKTARQGIAGAGDDNVYPFGLSTERTMLPAGDVDGNGDLSFDAVAPYRYPEFGSWPNPERGFLIAGTDIID